MQVKTLFLDLCVLCIIYIIGKYLYAGAYELHSTEVNGGSGNTVSLLQITRITNELVRDMEDKAILERAELEKFMIDVIDKTKILPVKQIEIGFKPGVFNNDVNSSLIVGYPKQRSTTEMMTYYNEDWFNTTLLNKKPTWGTPSTRVKNGKTSYVIRYNLPFFSKEKQLNAALNRIPIGVCSFIFEIRLEYRL